MSNRPATASRLKTRLNVHFAIATCLSSLTLSGNPDIEMLPVIACFFAIIGLVFVDLLRWFALPPTAAYISLGAIALYSIGQFTELGFGLADDKQMELVAELLVLVKAVLMLQQKNRRIYEQLAIFCLLELIVAAIFNDAFIYGLLLLPLGVIGAAGLALLQAYVVSEETLPAASLDSSPPPEPSLAVVRTRSPGSSQSFQRWGLVLPAVTACVLTPAVLLLAMLFFYGLPRTHPAARSGSGGKVLVGFSENVRLGQIGRMLQSDSLALRIELFDRGAEKPYMTHGPLYLRGAVLEKYNTDYSNQGSWTALDVQSAAAVAPLPPAPGAIFRDGLPVDDVRVRITLEPTNGPALFAIPPFHQLGTGPAVVSQEDRWILKRRPGIGLSAANRITYPFGSSAFSNGQQIRYVPRWPPGPNSDSPPTAATRDAYAAARYVRRCLEYDAFRIPSAKRLAATLLTEPTADPLELATRIEDFLTYRGGFQYTLDLSGETRPGIDPLEQFLDTDRRGNCQHFASAMVLMLRSQGIPARLVVGYSTDEYNLLGGYHAARQLHAHAWVEALIDARFIPADKRISDHAEPTDEAVVDSATVVNVSEPGLAANGRSVDTADREIAANDWRLPGEDSYWVRFDPTPGGGGVERPSGGRVTDVFEFAQHFWADYVVDRNAASGTRDSTSAGRPSAITSQYESMFRWIDRKLIELRSGGDGDGFAIGSGFSWVAALGFFALAMLTYLLLQARHHHGFGWPGRRRRGAATGPAAMPQIAFFADTLRLLARVGIERSPGQTPLELTSQAAKSLEQPEGASLKRPLRLLTDAFYDTRYRDPAGVDSTAEEPLPADLVAAIESVRNRVEAIESRSPTPPHQS